MHHNILRDIFLTRLEIPSMNSNFVKYALFSDPDQAPECISNGDSPSVYAHDQCSSRAGASIAWSGSKSYWPAKSEKQVYYASAKNTVYLT